MSWIDKLYLTYENNLEHVGNQNEAIPLLPLYHSTQNAQVHVVLDGNGNFLRASVVNKDDAQTIIPATEESAGRSGSKIAPHPLFDTLQYVAGDYLSWGGNPRKKKNESGYEPYITALQGWTDWSNNHKLQSVLTYLRKGCLIKNLVEHKVLFGDCRDQLIEIWNETQEAPPIFKAIKLANKKGQYEAFVRFSVEIPGVMPSELWKDAALQESWSKFYSTLQKDTDVCMVNGEKINIASSHPKNIRYPGDGAKLVSSNDTEGFTYLGRFTSDKEACSIGIEVTQKTHNALRWLIKRQGRSDGDQAIVAWAISGTEVPDLLADTYSLVFGVDQESASEGTGYTAQEIGVAFSKLIAGYSSKLGSTEDIVVMGLDSATPGRMAITFYRELTGSELLKRVQTWHEGCAWPQRFGKNKVFVGAPSPRDIAETAYGRRLDDKLRKATIERLLPCIVDGTSIQRDLVESCARRASNRNGIESWEWEKALGIACALYRHHNKERRYKMALERERKTRDYLYGRLLALAEHMESRALYVAGEKRETNAGKLMQRFAERPYSTWRTIETSLTPYKVRLRAKRSKFLHGVETEMDLVFKSFNPDDYISDKRLTGEFLLEFHCQRAELRPPESGQETADVEDVDAEE